MDPSEIFSGVENEEQRRDEDLARDGVGRPGAGVVGGDAGPVDEAGFDGGVGEDLWHQDPVDFVILSQLLIRHLDNILGCSL